MFPNAIALKVQNIYNIEGNEMGFWETAFAVAAGVLFAKMIVLTGDFIEVFFFYEKSRNKNVTLSKIARNLDDIKVQLENIENELCKNREELH